MRTLVSVFLIVVILVAFSTCALAGWVNGYYRSNGTYVKGHYRSDPNGTVKDNWSYKGNVNPHTGKIGTNKYENDSTSDYYKPFKTSSDSWLNN
jgi:hypothetical protein